MARAVNDVAAARPSKRRETVVVRVGIESSVLLFLISFNSEREPCNIRPLRPDIILGRQLRETNFEAKLEQKKRRRGMNRIALLHYCFAGDQVCWIAESSQFAPRGR